MKLILFATKREALKTINYLQAKPLPEHKILIWSEGVVHSEYQFDEGWIALSGFGIQAAQLAVSKYASKIDEVWNLGCAGALNTTLSIGELYAVERVGKYLPHPSFDPLTQECFESNVPVFNVGHKGIRLVSSEFPLFDQKIRKKIHSDWDSVDMEGYGIAFAAHYLQIKCRMWKIISDFADKKGRKNLHTHIEEYSEKIAQHVMSFFDSPVGADL